MQTLTLLWPKLVAVLTVVLALAASAHAVLVKRDVRAAVGWVGFILFVPIAGAVVYYLLGINRIHRRAKARFGARKRVASPTEAFAARAEHVATVVGEETGLERLAALIGKVVDRPILRGNRVTPLVNGEAAYPAMLAAIAAARRSVTLGTYIFDNDAAGDRFVDALAAAVARGVEVRVLIDDAGARYSIPSIVRKLRKRGVRVARFMRTLWPTYLAYINLRNHRKILVVDGQIGFTGGMNIRVGHLIAEAPKAKVQDLHFQLEGPIVGELQACFAEDWAFTTGERLEGERWFGVPQAAGATLARTVIDGPEDEVDAITWALLGALACARKSVRIATPYFLPSAPLLTALEVADMRGVDVQILLPAENNLSLVKWASTPFLPELLEHGCRIYLTRPPFDHTKLMIVDDAWSFIGSSNWDPRSLRLNFELNVECYGTEVAAALNAIWEAKRRTARPLTLDELANRSLSVRLRDGIARLFSPYL